MRAATDGSLPPIMPQQNLVEALGRELRQEWPAELMVEGFPSHQRRPACKTDRGMSDEDAGAAVLTYLPTQLEVEHKVYARKISVSDVLALSCSSPRARPHPSPLMIPQVNLIRIPG